MLCKSRDMLVAEELAQGDPIFRRLLPGSRYPQVVQCHFGITPSLHGHFLWPQHHCCGFCDALFAHLHHWLTLQCMCQITFKKSCFRAMQPRVLLPMLVRGAHACLRALSLRYDLCVLLWLRWCVPAAAQMIVLIQVHGCSLIPFGWLLPGSMGFSAERANGGVLPA